MSSQAELRDALFISSDSRANFKNVIAKRSDLAKFNGGRLKTSAATTTVTWEAGTVLGLATSGADSGYLKAYSNASTDGSEVAVGILAEQAVVDDAGNGSECVYLIGAIVFADLLIGYDAAAKTDLAAKEYVEHGTNLVSF